MIRFKNVFAALGITCLSVLGSATGEQTPLFNHPGQIDLTFGTNTTFPRTVAVRGSCTISSVANRQMEKLFASAA
jgi:hypothetical protein